MNKQQQQLSPSLLKQLGIDKTKIRKVETLEEIVKDPPLMVTAQVKHDATWQTGSGPLKIHKGSTLVMPLSQFMSTRRTTDNRKSILKPYRHPFHKLFRRYRGQEMHGKRLLIWRGGGFGDLCFLMPIMKHIKKLYPTCQITVASYPRFVPIYADFPPGLIENVLPVPFSANFLYNHHYHLTFEGAIERCIEAQNVNVYDLFSKVAGFDIDFTDDYYKLELYPNEKILEEFKNILPENFVVVQMRASSPIRMMSDSKWANIIKRIIDLDKKVVFIDRPDLHEYYLNFIKKYNLDVTKVRSFCSKCKHINHGVAIISKSDGVVAIDSAFTHIGVALNKPVVGIYGSFKGWLRMKYYKNADWIDAEDKVCQFQPCFFHHDEKIKCPSIKNKKCPACLETINEDLIIEKFKKLILKEDNNDRRES